MNQYYLLSNVILAASEGNDRNSSMVFGVQFSFFAIMAIVYQIFGKAILKKLGESDHLSGQVRPRLYGIVYLSAIEALFLVSIVMSIILDALTYMAMCIIVFLGLGLYMVHIFGARLEYNETYLIYRSLRKTKIFAPEEIWRISREIDSSFGYTVKLYLLDGTELEFPEAYYVGTHALFRMFSQDDYEEPQDKQDPETKEATL